jgi:hypothetical protein
MPWFLWLLIGVALDVLAALLMPRPKKPPIPAPVTPQVTAGDPIPVVFGSVTIKDPNVLWFGDVGVSTIQVSTKK